MHKAMVDYYRAYSDPNGIMNFHQFIKFCKDFSIFPDILAQQKLGSFFRALASIYATSYQQGNKFYNITIFNSKDV